jgi:N-acetyl-gamma-glutamyl-phosphate reductase
MIRVAILGATGYSALELFKILLRHPEVEITCATSRQEGNLPIGSIHPALASRIDLRVEDLPPKEVATRADCIFGCLPHGVTAEITPDLLSAKAKVIDLSAEYRLKSAATYEQWYNQKHADPERLETAVYGLPELFRKEIVPAELVANPGCYPTSAVLALAPLLKRGIIKPDGIIIDSKSGVSGAGRSPKLTTHFPECNESVSAYNVGKHRHTPEIEQVLSTASGMDIQLIFTPHLIPMDRGMMSTAYSCPKHPITSEQVMDTLREFYADEPFVRVVDHLPATKDSVNTNFCDVTARVVRDRIVTVSCLDNLIKGAAGAAVQNMNLMFGLKETTALL